MLTAGEAGAGVDAVQAVQFVPPPISMPPLAPYLEHPGDPPSPWAHWYETFEDFWAMATVGRATQYTDQDRNRYLVMMLGTEGRRLVRHTTTLSNIGILGQAAFATAIRDILRPKSSPFRALSALLHRRQRSGESVQQFLTDLRDLASRCPLPDTTEDFWLASLLVVGCASEKAKERLFQLDAVELPRVLDVLLSDQAVRTDLQAEKGNPSTLSAVTRGRRPVRGVVGGGRGGSGTGSATVTCFNCGGPHFARDPTCFAAGKTCNNCGKVGHLSRYCKSGGGQQKGGNARGRGRGTSSGQGGRRGGNQQTNVLFLPDSPSESSVQGQLVAQISPTSRIYTEVDFWNGRGWAKLRMEADSGAVTSTLRRSDLNALRISLPLTPPDPATKLLNYDRTPLKGVKGSIWTKLGLGGRCAEGILHVVPDAYDTILGRNFLHALGAIIDCGAQQVKALGVGPREAFPKLFGKTVGTFPGYLHRIQLTENAVPTVCRLRSIPLARRNGALEEVRKMDADGIWEPVNRSQWVHGMVTVPKPEGGVRITTDLSPLNTYVVPETHPIPAIKEVFLELHGATVFSKMDFRKGFFHIALHPDSRPLTTTVTPLGLRQYTRLPMGLKESSSVFQRLVAQTLAGLDGVVFYIDDILVFGKNQAEHDGRLQKVLQRLEGADFRLAPDKCQFGASQVRFLGHLIGKDGVRPDPKNLQAIKECPPPTTVSEVLTFLGMVDFYRDFLRDVVSLVEPLRRLTRKAQPWKWGTEEEMAFKTVRAVLEEDLRVYLFDPAAPTIVTTDASDLGVGAVLSQQQMGREVPIAFASSTLNSSQRNYSASEREAWACVWALEHWEKYLLGRPFVLRTDHSALKTLLTSRATRRESSKFPRWLDRLLVFDFKPEYVKGTENKVADALSRLVARARELGVTMDRGEVVSAISFDTCAAETAKDPLLMKIKGYMEKGWPKQGKVETDIAPYFKMRNELSWNRGCLWREGGRMVLPGALRTEVLEKAHEGHPGMVRLKRLIRKTWFWPRMGKDVEDWVRGCHGCAVSEKSVPTDKQKGRRIPAPDLPGAQWGVDIAGPFYNGKYILVAVDYASGWPELTVKRTIASRDVIEWLEEMFTRNGLPQALVTDNGPQFVSRELEDFLAERDIHHYTTAVYNPQENGLVERFNRTLKTTIQAAGASGTSWDKAIRDFLMSYRATPREGGESPARIFIGREMRMKCQPNPSEPMRIDTERNVKARFQVGDKVGMKVPQVDKGMPTYKGPKIVQEVLGRYTFRLSDGKKWNSRKVCAWPGGENMPAFIPSPSGREPKVPEKTRGVLRSPYPQRTRRPPERFGAGEVGHQRARMTRR